MLTFWPETVDGNGYVVIENQMEISDNEHLAGLLNYAAHSNSRILIWVAGGFTEAHRRTLDWLNDGKGMTIYGVEVSAWRNGDAVERRLCLAAGPNQRMEWPGYEFPADKRRYLDFFGPLVGDLRAMHIADRGIARPDNDQEFPSGFPGISYHIGFWGGYTRPSLDVYLWIAAEDKDRNKEIFDALHRHQTAIEGELPGVSWVRRDRERMCSIYFSQSGSITDSEEKLEELREWALNTLLNLKAVFQPYLDQVMGELESKDAKQ